MVFANAMPSIRATGVSCAQCSAQGAAQSGERWARRAPNGGQWWETAAGLGQDSVDMGRGRARCAQRWPVTWRQQHSTWRL
eukprot:353880-Chlamydomonas_euryale.AAC.26